MEVKSRFESVIYENHKTNILIKFINKALKFKNIFLNDSSMHYDINVENSRIEELYRLI